MMLPVATFSPRQIPGSLALPRCQGTPVISGRQINWRCWGEHFANKVAEAGHCADSFSLLTAASATRTEFGISSLDSMLNRFVLGPKLVRREENLAAMGAFV